MIKQRKLKVISIYERYIMISMGIIVMSMGFYYFILPANLVVGGVTGLGLVLSTSFEGFPISAFVLVLNMVLLLTGLLFLGKKLFVRSIYGSLLFFLNILANNLNYIIITLLLNRLIKKSLFINKN